MPLILTKSSSARLDWSKNEYVTTKVPHRQSYWTRYVYHARLASYTHCILCIRLARWRCSRTRTKRGSTRAQRLCRSGHLYVTPALSFIKLRTHTNYLIEYRKCARNSSCSWTLERPLMPKLNWPRSVRAPQIILSTCVWWAILAIKSLAYQVSNKINNNSAY